MKPDKIKQLALETMKILWEMQNERDRPFIIVRGSNLILPIKRPPNKPDVLRVSEQEARVIFIQMLERMYPDVLYSIEAPTKKKYKFTKTAKNTRSGNIDLCLFDPKSLGIPVRDLIIEFKAHNSSACENDFEKLFKESEDGLFFHLLESANRSTLTANTKNRSGILMKYNEALRNRKSLLATRRGKMIHFVIGCLSPQFLLFTSLRLTDKDQKGFFNLDYTIENQNFKKVNLGNWEQLHP